MDVYATILLWRWDGSSILPIISLNSLFLTLLKNLGWVSILILINILHDIISIQKLYHLRSILVYCRANCWWKLLRRLSCLIWMRSYILWCMRSLKCFNLSTSRIDYCALRSHSSCLMHRWMVWSHILCICVMVCLAITLVPRIKNIIWSDIFILIYCLIFGNRIGFDLITFVRFHPRR